MFKYLSNLLDFNQATLSGCVDTIVIEQDDRSLICSPFHVRFGKLKILKYADKEVNVIVNGKDTGIKMRLRKTGEAYFLKLVEPDNIEDEKSLDSKKENELKEKTKEADPKTDDIYKDLEFFENPKGENFDSTNKAEQENEESSSGDEIEKTKSEKEYNNIINDLTVEKDKEVKTPKSAKRSRFRWLWGEAKDVPNITDPKLEASHRERSKSESGDAIIRPALSTGQVEPENPKILINNQADAPSPTRKGIFRRVKEFFTGSQKKDVKGDAPTFKIEKIQPKKGDFGEVNPLDSNAFKHDVGMSLCKHLLYTCDKEDINTIFEENLITFDEFCDRYEEIIEDPKLILRIHNELYDWRTGVAIIFANIAFGKNLESRGFDFQNKIDSYAHKQTKDDSSDQQKEIVEKDNHKNGAKSECEYKYLNDIRDNFNIKRSRSENPDEVFYLKQIDQNDILDKQLSDCNLDDDDLYQPKINQIKDIEIPLDRGLKEECKEVRKNKKRRYKKTLFLDSDQLKDLGLQYGRNEISYSVDSGFQGIQTVNSRIFFWNHKVKIVISDVDGTITRSDVLGHILPRLGKDWSHEGVTELFTNIRKNGYEFMYLTSRAIGMADSTRSYLNDLEQNESFKLPDGPCIMSPDRLFPAFKREVIDRKPQLFKIAALLNIKNLFKDGHCPFYAGFGNRDTDAISYRAVGINIKRIFIINPQGEVIVLKSMYKKSYPLMNDLVDQMFPLVCSARQKYDENNEEETSAFNDFNYWNTVNTAMENINDSEVVNKE